MGSSSTGSPAIEYKSSEGIAVLGEPSWLSWLAIVIADIWLSRLMRAGWAPGADMSVVMTEAGEEKANDEETSELAPSLELSEEGDSSLSTAEESTCMP